MNNKKIGIATITIEDSFNYGNKLQTYALQSFLRQNGYEAETIRYEASYVRRIPAVPKNMHWQNLISQSVVQSLDDMLRILKRKIESKKLEQLHHKRKEGFRSFEQANITYTEEIYYHDSPFTNLSKSFDCFISGSDQVWNPYYEGIDPFFYLCFAEKGKRIAYAPSIAVEQIPTEKKENMGQWIREMDYISIREIAGKELLAREFGVDARLVCDPVFLLSREQWRQKAASLPEKKPYFAVYLLGKKTIVTKWIIRKLEKTFGIYAVDIYTRDDPASAFATPEEFLSLIENAQFVLTDSFHGTAFSVIFQVPMVLLGRYSANRIGSRIESLLSTIGVGDRSAAFILENPDRLAVEYGACEARMRSFVESSKTFLISSIEACTENC